MLRGVQLTLTAVQLIGLVDTKLIEAAHKIKNYNEDYEGSKCTNSRISVVDAMPETASPGPMIVYALTLYSTAVLGGRSLSVSCVADVLV